MAVTVILCIGLAFLAVQLTMLAKARREAHRRCSAWRERCFEDRYRRLTRGQAILDLERSVAASPAAGSLRRLGVTAPLLGVALTAGTLMFAPPAELGTLISGIATPPASGAGGSDSGAASAMASPVAVFPPLLAGVLVGAVLAIINQVLVASQERHEDEALHAALEAVPTNAFRDTDDSLDALYDALKAAGTMLGGAMESVGSLSSRIRALMEEVGDASSLACENLRNVAGQLESSVAMPSRDFKAAAERMRKAAEDCAAKLERAAESAEVRLRGVESSAEAALTAQAGAMEQHRRLAERMTSACQVMTDAASALADTGAPSLADGFSGTAAAAREMTAEMGNSARSLSGAVQTVNEVRKAVESLASVVQPVSQTVVDLPSHAGRASEQMAQFAAALERLVKSLDDAEVAMRGPNSPSRRGLTGLFQLKRT